MHRSTLTSPSPLLSPAANIVLARPVHVLLHALLHVFPTRPRLFPSAFFVVLRPLWPRALRLKRPSNRSLPSGIQGAVITARQGAQGKKANQQKRGGGGGGQDTLVLVPHREEAVTGKTGEVAGGSAREEREWRTDSKEGRVGRKCVEVRGARPCETTEGRRGAKRRQSWGRDAERESGGESRSTGASEAREGRRAGGTLLLW